MKIFIEIPTWLGDAVMTTPAIENIIATYPKCELTIFGSLISTKLFLYHPNIKNVIIDNSKKNGNRYINLYRLSKNIGRVDIALSFRKNFTTKFLLWFINSKDKYIYIRYSKQQIHQVIRYNDFINRSLKINTIPSRLKIYTQNTILKSNKPILGINPGATYGSAKRWYPSEFASTAIELSKNYDIKIFGGPSETNIATDIENELIKADIINYENLAGNTNVEELIEQISRCNLFITNDSGPMHIAAAFNIPTIAIFGPTKDIETHQWNNDHEMLIKKNLECAPCMKRVCPLKHHNCMKLITAQNVLDRLKQEDYI